MYQPCDIIRNAIKNNKLSHAYLFYSDNGVDIEKHTLEAINIVANLIGKKNEINDLDNLNYYDLKVVKPNKNDEIIKEDVDIAIQSLYETSLEKDSIKILYIKNIDKGNKHSLNMLLKFVEEPINNLIIFMNTNHFDNVISTIRSRSQNIYIKRENLDEKINLMKNIYPQATALVANIYANVKQLESIDLKLFEKTYNQIIGSFNEALSSKYTLKENIESIWTKENNDFVLNILQYFFYQLMVDIDNQNPLFPNQDDLIIQFKKKNINCFKIQSMIEKVKKDIDNYANFNLQKINFLNNLENELII